MNSDQETMAMLRHLCRWMQSEMAKGVDREDVNQTAMLYVTINGIVSKAEALDFVRKIKIPTYMVELRKRRGNAYVNQLLDIIEKEQMKNCTNCPSYQEVVFCSRRFSRTFDADNPHIWCRNEDEE